MNAQTSENIKLLETHKKLSLHYLTGHDIEWYVSYIARPAMYLIVLNITLHVAGGLPSLNLTFNAVFLPIIFLAEIVTYARLGWLIIYKASVKTLDSSMKLFSGACAGALTGLSVGIVMTLFKIFWFRNIWTIYNIATEPVIRLLEGFVVAGVAASLTLFFMFVFRKRN